MDVSWHRIRINEASSIVNSEYIMKFKNLLRTIYKLMVLFGIDPIKTIQAIRGFPYYLRDLSTLRKQQKNSDVNFLFGRLYPCLGDRFAQSGTASGHYFHQDLLIARRIFLNNPELHVDIGSRIDGFVAHVASFRKIEMFDIRELKNDIPKC